MSYQWGEVPKRDRLGFVPDPRILTHPNVPPPLHGVAPRVVMGQAWWDRVRKAAYAKHNYHCHACGVHKSMAKGNRKHLEAHEYYEIDYAAGTVTYLRAVALCPWCHQFIHTGRLHALWEKREVSTRYAKAIIAHGMRLLSLVNAYNEAFWFTQVFECMLFNGASYEGAVAAVAGDFERMKKEDQVPWGEWRLIIGERAFAPKFPTREAWLEHYDAKGSDSAKRAHDMLNGI